MYAGVGGLSKGPIVRKGNKWVVCALAIEGDEEVAQVRQWNNPSIPVVVHHMRKMAEVLALVEDYLPHKYWAVALFLYEAPLYTHPRGRPLGAAPWSLCFCFGLLAFACQKNACVWAVWFCLRVGFRFIIITTSHSPKPSSSPSHTHTRTGVCV